MNNHFEERCVLWIRGVQQFDVPAQQTGPWLERTIRGAQLSGGRVECVIGLTLVVSYDGIDLEDAIDLARHVLDLAREGAPSLSAHIGLALGDVVPDQVPDYQGATLAWLGSAFDRAQALSHDADEFEIVFDEQAQLRAAEHWLFARELLSAHAHGYALERVHFSKRACRASLGRLRPAPLPVSNQSAFDQLQQISQWPGQQRVALHSSSRETAIECVERILALQPPALRLVISSCAGSLRPLGSLALALRRIWPSDDELQRAPLPEAVRTVLVALTSGRAVQRSDLVEALTSLLEAEAQSRPSIVLEELPEIDPATLSVVSEVLRTPELDAFVLMTLPFDGVVPMQLRPKPNQALHEVFLPALPMEDRVEIATAVLSLPPDSEIAARVALLGGPHLHGLVEAIRTLVSAGDLVWEEQQFSWRSGPRQGANSLPVEALITERAVGLEPAAYRVLEVLCSCPRQASRDFVRRVAELDGMSADEFRAGADPLASEGWLDALFSLNSADSLVRGILRQMMPPARALELQGFVVELLQKNLPEPCFGSGELAYHLLEAGHGPAAANALVDAAHCAMENGFQRMALRLLATAVEWEPSTEIRKVARRIARVVGPPAESKARSNPPIGDESSADGEDFEPPESIARTAMQSALDALHRRDFDGTERWLDAARAGGASRAATQRVLAIANVLRGDLEGAVNALQGSHDAALPSAVRARDTLCWAIVRLAAGHAPEAARVALAGLAQARQLHDPLGEAASLQVLALTYRELDRDEDALQLEAAAASRQREFVPLSRPA